MNRWSYHRLPSLGLAVIDEIAVVTAFKPRLGEQGAHRTLFQHRETYKFMPNRAFKEDYSLAELSEVVGQVARRHNITAVYLFGSRARGDNRKNSDYDMIVEVGPGFRAFDIFSFEDELEAILKCDVGAMTASVLRDDTDFTREILKERIRIYG